MGRAFIFCLAFFIWPLTRNQRHKVDASSDWLGDDTPDYEWSEEWLTRVPIDHFSYGDLRTFSMRYGSILLPKFIYLFLSVTTVDFRYLINKRNFRPGGAMFFYPGNEGKIEGFAKNTVSSQLLVCLLSSANLSYLLTLLLG